MKSQERLKPREDRRRNAELAAVSTHRAINSASSATSCNPAADEETRIVEAMTDRVPPLLSLNTHHVD